MFKPSILKIVMFKEHVAMKRASVRLAHV